MPDVDVVVVGSGAGGLAAALTLARAGKRTLVLEQNAESGGLSRSHDLGGFRFSPGVQYIGDLGPGGYFRALLEGLGLGGEITFRELNPDGYDRLLVGRERFDVPAGAEAFRERLIERFPAERDGINSYFAMCQELVAALCYEDWSDETGRVRSSLAHFRPSLVLHGCGSYAAYLSHFFQDPLLKAFLALRAGDHGLGPAKAPAALHVAVEGHYLSGAWFPVGGGGALSAALVRALVAHGGTLTCNARVRKILLRDGRTEGVELEDGSTVASPCVLSNADPVVTWKQLVGDEHTPRRLRRRVEKLRMSCSVAALYLGVRDDLRARGLDSGNVWWSRTEDVDEMWRGPLLDGPVDGDGDGNAALLALERLPGLFLSSATLKDPELRTDGLHTLEALAFVSGRGLACDAASADSVLRDHLRELVYAAIEDMVPGLRERVVFEALHTPRDVARYAGTTVGAIYGTEKTLLNLGGLSFPLRSPVEGLYECGASTIAPGIYGVMNSGLRAAAAILGVPARELLTPGPPIVTLTAEPEPVAVR